MTKVKCDGRWKNLIFLMIALALLSAAAGAASASVTFTELQFVIYDSTFPSINESSTRPAAGAQYNQTQTVPLLIDTSENVTVIANVSYDSASQAVALYYNGTQWYYNSTFTSTLWPGQYNVTFNVTDIAGNSNYTSTNFIVSDITPPAVTSLAPAAGTNYSQETSISLSANVTDPYYNSIDTVLANITWDSAYQEITLAYNSTTALYQGTFTNTTATGRYNITIIANDTSSNKNSTESSYFNVLDLAAPAINGSNTQPQSGAQYNQTQTVPLLIDASENVTVIANVSYDSTSELVSLAYNGTQWYYNSTFSNTLWPGQYNVTFNVTDIAGNSNTTSASFTIKDISAPSVTNISPVSGSNYTQNAIINITANITDLYYNSIDKVLANLTWDSTYKEVVLTYNTTTALYQGTFTNTTAAGRYNITIIANDTSSNKNSTETTSFTINDITPPNVISLAPAAGTSYAVGTQVNITANISDPYYNSVDKVLANITWDSAYATVVMTDHNADGIYNCSFVNTSLPYDFNVTIIANDTSGNTNSTEKTNFSIVDAINPSLENVSLSPRVVIRGRNVSINASATDNVVIDGVFANITLPNGTVRLVSLPANYTSEVNGRNNVTIFANDTSGNLDYITDYFIVADPINITITVFDSNLSAITTNLTIYLAGTTEIVDIETIIGNITREEPAYYYDLLFTAYESNITILLRDIYMPLDDNESFGIENLIPAVSGYILTYGLNTTFNFTTATVTISYVGQNYTTESNLRLDKCSSWDFTNNTCLGTWTETSAAQDTSADTFTLNVTSFSAFSIREVAAVQPSGGGRGRGGGGAAKEEEPKPAPACREDWICSDWSECMPDNVTARMCVDWNKCGTENYTPKTEKTCNFTFVLPELPEEMPAISIEMPLRVRIGEIAAILVFIAIVLAVLLLFMTAWGRMMYPPEMKNMEFIELETMLPIDESKEKGIIRKFEVEKVEDFKEIIEFARHGPAVMLISIKKMAHNMDGLKRGVRILKKTLKATDGDIAGLRDHWVIATSFSIKIAKSNFVKEIAKESKKR